MVSFKIKYWILFLSLLFNKAAAQKFNFVRYSVEEGLAQSQATSIVQDSLHNLWITHLGGLSRFDGKNFTTYTTEDGMLSNFNNKLLIDKHQNIWIGSHLGISVFDGKKFKNFNLGVKGKSSIVYSLAIDKANKIWTTYAGELYTADINQCVKVQLPFKNKVTTVGQDGDKNILIATEDASFYRLVNDKWNRIFSAGDTKEKVIVRGIYTGNSKRCWLLTGKDLYEFTGNKIVPYALHTKILQNVLSMYEDLQGAIWFGTSKGVYKFQSGNIEHFDNSKGFTNHSVYDILDDAEGNTWFATIGSGIIKYNHDHVFYFDKELLYNIGVNGITKDENGNVWFGTYGGGLRRFNGKELKSYSIPSKNASANIINFCISDNKGGIWIGTQGGGLWFYNKNIFNNISEKFALEEKNFYSGDINKKGEVVVASSKGVYLYSEHTLQRVNGPDIFSNSVKFIGKDSILVGTPQGVLLFDNYRQKDFHQNKELSQSSILVIKRYQDNIYLGTADRGLFIIEIKTGMIHQITMKDGLGSNSIYDLVVDERNSLWLSTGFYLNHLSLTDKWGVKKIHIIGKSKGILSPEGNTSSLFFDSGKLWLGTLEGINIINVAGVKEDTVKPKAILTGIKLFSKPVTDSSLYDSLSKFYSVPMNLQLPYNKNHLTFEFIGIKLSNPENIRYQYYIKGLENDFSQPSTLNSVVYSSIPPGSYSFILRAVTTDGLISSNYVTYNFTIKTPFYKSIYFQLLVFALLVLAGFLIRSVQVKTKERKQLAIEKIKEEEQIKVRRKTAEDFHDDIGNKLSRINILSEILKKRYDEKEVANDLINQIQDNTSALYSGANDIIWSLSNEYGNFFDVLQRLKDFGSDLFRDTEITFESSVISEEFKKISMSSDISRNLTMIIKEAMNNALKYSKAKAVFFAVEIVKDDLIKCTLIDNGIGFNKQAVKGGYGLGNIITRAKRINAEVDLSSTEGKGTIITLLFRLS